MDVGNLEHLDVLDAHAPHGLGDRVGGAADLGGGKAGGGDAGNARQLDQRLLEVVEMAVEVVKGRLHVAVGLRHPASFTSIWQSTIVLRARCGWQVGRSGTPSARGRSLRS